MKKSIILGILGLTVGAVSSYGQGAVFLDNYISSIANPVVFSAGLGGGNVGAGYTVGLYVSAAQSNITGSLLADPTGFADPSTLGALTLASGANATAAVATSAGGVAGYFSAPGSYLIQPSSATPAQSSYTIMLVAYNGASYAASTIRGHSIAEYIGDAAPSVANGADLGGLWPASTPIITVFQTVPEPTTMALGGLGLAALLVARRKKA